MSSILRWGLCCAGQIAGDFATAVNLLSRQEHQLIAVAARQLEKAQCFAEKHKIQKAYGSYTELANDSDIDVVYISSIHTKHAELSQLFINAGKHVLCEKPMCMNVKEAKGVVALAKEKRVFFMEGFWSRFFPVYGEVRQALSDNIIGDTRIVTVQFGFPVYHTDPPYQLWAVRKDLGASTLMALGCYGVMFASMVYGGEKPINIIANANLHETGYDLTTNITLQYSNGRMAHIISTNDCGLQNDAVIGGTKGKIVVKAPFWKPLKVDINGKEFQDKSIESPDHGFLYEAKCVRDCILKGVQECPKMTHNESLTILEIMDEIRRQIGVEFPADLNS